MNKKIKVIYLITSLKRCGPVNVIYSIVKNLDLDKFEPIIVTMKKEASSSRLDDFINCGVTIYSRKNFLSCLMMIKALNKNKETIVLHSHGIIPDFINVLFKHSTFINISTIHSNLIEDYDLSFGKYKGKLLVLIHCWILNRLICVSCAQSVQAKLNEKKGLNSIAISNGVPFEDKLVPQKKDMKDKNIKIVYIGTVSKRKNVDFLIRAVSKLKDLKVILNIVGNGPEQAALKNKYHENSNIIFSGFKSDTTSEFQQADIIASASESEGLPLAILEGLSFGKPLFLSRIDSHLEILDKNKIFGASFEIADLDNFSVNLKKLLGDMSDGMTIYREAKVYFSDKVMAEKYEKLYERLV